MSKLNIRFRRDEITYIFDLNSIAPIVSVIDTKEIIDDWIIEQFGQTAHIHNLSIHRLRDIATYLNHIPVNVCILPNCNIVTLLISSNQLPNSHLLQIEVDLLSLHNTKYPDTLIKEQLYQLGYDAELFHINVDDIFNVDKDKPIYLCDHCYT